MARPERPEQVLIIEPQNELRFRGPFTSAPVTSYIKLINPSNNKIYFKIKTTAPKRYCVRPNAGVLKGKEVTEIAVSLQPYDFDPSEKNKHKFMVQTLLAYDNDEDDYQTDIWKEAKPEQLMDSKLKCVFENPLTSATTAKTTTTTTTAKSDGEPNEGKNKGTGDSVKTSPVQKPVLGDTEEKLLKAALEVNQLRVEESALRQENLQLKEDLLKWRTLVLSNDANSNTEMRLASATNSPFTQTSTTNVIIAIAIMIVGYIIGKLI